MRLNSTALIMAYGRQHEVTSALFPPSAGPAGCVIGTLSSFRADRHWYVVAVATIDSGTLRSWIVVRRPPSTTHTIEMAQIKEINAKLRRRSGVVITASELPLETQPGDRHVPVDPSAPLTRLSWTGSPSFPDIAAHFTAPGSKGSRRGVLLHTAALKEISRRLGLHHAWGVRP
jgi:hypothetical protein